MQTAETSLGFSRLFNSAHEIGKSRRRTQQWTIPRLRELGVLSGKILSAGCGNGADVAVMREYGYDAWGFELYKAEALSKGFMLASVTEIPFQDSTFDAVTLLEVIEHLLGVERVNAAAEIRRVLKSDGWMIITTPNLRFPIDEHGTPIRFHSPFRDFTLSIGELESLFGKAKCLTWEKYWAFERFGRLGEWFTAIERVFDPPLIHRSFVNPHFYLAFQKKTGSGASTCQRSL
jgi:SAM-dependent methyltransferase